MSSAAPEVLVILSIFFIANGALGFCVVGLYVQTIPRHGSWKYPFWMLWCVNLALDVAGTGLAAFCLVELQAAGRRHEADAWAWIADILAGLGRLGLLVRVFLTYYLSIAVHIDTIHTAAGFRLLITAHLLALGLFAVDIFSFALACISWRRKASNEFNDRVLGWIWDPFTTISCSLIHACAVFSLSGDLRRNWRLNGAPEEAFVEYAFKLFLHNAEFGWVPRTVVGVSAALCVDVGLGVGRTVQVYQVLHGTQEAEERMQSALWVSMVCFLVQNILLMLFFLPRIVKVGRSLLGKRDCASEVSESKVALTSVALDEERGPRDLPLRLEATAWYHKALTEVDQESLSARDVFERP